MLLCKIAIPLLNEHDSSSSNSNSSSSYSTLRTAHADPNVPIRKGWMFSAGFYSLS